MNISKLTHIRVARGENIAFHLLALAIIIIWGTTFVSTKVLLQSGLNPSGIMLYRFILAYSSICLFSKPFKIFADNVRDEFLCMLSGLFGGTLYFITENTALDYTFVSNVALICSITPLLTMLAQCFVLKQAKLSKSMLIGSTTAFAGVAMVILNGRFVFNFSPIGDLLCLASALAWTVYTFITKALSDRYSPMFLVRKTFFYGIITLIPLLLCDNSFTFDTALLANPKVWTQLLFLGVVASFLCFMLWNVCLKRMDTVLLSNYIYLNPVISIITSNLILGERINTVIITGTAMVIGGMYAASKKQA